jgi:hypothetical protein
VALGPSDVVEVVVLAAGAGTLLGTDRPAVRRHLVTDEVGLERHHAGDGEHHGRIVRDERCGRHHGMVLHGEEVQEGLSELVRGDQFTHRNVQPTDARMFAMFRFFPSGSWQTSIRDR